MAHLVRTYDLSPRAAEVVARFRAIIDAQLQTGACQIVAMPPGATVLHVLDTTPPAVIGALDAAFAALPPLLARSM